jgi:hypothetical protein
MLCTKRNFLFGELRRVPAYLGASQQVNNHPPKRDVTPPFLTTDPLSMT